MRIGIVGNGADKFTEESENYAKTLIHTIISDNIGDEDWGDDMPVIVSGHSPVGGIDIWAEEIALARGCEIDIKTPRQNKWDAEYGYKQRNLDIARDSDVVYVIVVEDYPPNYKGMRFAECYHCRGRQRVHHVKSEACWTANQALRMGKEAYWIII